MRSLVRVIAFCIQKYYMDVAKFSDQTRPLGFLDTSAWVFIRGICVGKFSCTGHDYDVSHLLENEPINKATNDYLNKYFLGIKEREGW